MTPDWNLCNICGEVCPKQTRMFIETDRPMSPAGDRDSAGEHVDLCNLCAVSILKKVVTVPNIISTDNFGIAKYVLSVIHQGTKK